MRTSRGLYCRNVQPRRVIIMIIHCTGNGSFIKRHKSPPTFLQFSACHGDMHQTYPAGHAERCILLEYKYLYYIFFVFSCRTTIGVHTARPLFILMHCYRAICRDEKNSRHVLIFTRRMPREH